MSSSTNAEAPQFGALPLPELRTGKWTRLGDRSLLGDPITETFLAEVADRARAAAEAEGYAAGWAKGKADVEANLAQNAADRTAEMEAAFDLEAQRLEAEHREAVSTALDVLARAAEDVRMQVAQLCDRVEQQASQLAWDVVETLLDRELITAGSADVVRRVLSIMPPTPLVTVRLHPTMLQEADLDELYDRGVEVIPDDAIGKYEAMVASDGAVIDLRIRSAVERVRAVLEA